MEVTSARNENALEKLRVMLEGRNFDCALCSRELVDPRILQCAHSFCFDCLEQRVSDACITCVTCGQTAQVPAQGVVRLRKDLVLVTLLEARDLLHDGCSMRCTVCDRNRAAHACFTCNALLCVRCHNNHQHEASDGQQHDTCALRQLRQADSLARFQASRFGVCAKHLRRNALFCRFEDMQVCEHCVSEQVHAQHVIVPLNVKVAELAESLVAKCNQLSGE